MKTETRLASVCRRFTKLSTLAVISATCVAQAQITFTPVFSKVWDVPAGTYPGMPANTGNNCRGIGISPFNGNVLYFSSTGGTNGGNSHVGILSGSNGSNYLANLSGTGITGGTVGTEGVRVADDGTIYGFNLAGASNSVFKVYKWLSDSDTTTAPTVVFNSSTVFTPPDSSFRWRVGDYTDLRGSGANTEIVAVGNGSGAAITTNFVVLRPTDASCTAFTNFSITIPGSSASINLCGAGVAFEGTNNAIWIRRAGSQETRHIVYNPATMTAICDRTNNVDQSVCQGLKYYKANGVELLATVQANSALNSVQIARVFQIPTSPTAALISVLSSNLPLVTGSQNGNGLGNVDFINGYAAFGAPGQGISLFSLSFATNSPPTSVTLGSSATTVVGGYGLNVTFTGTAAGSAPLKYQWVYFNSTTTNILISNSTNSVYTVSNVVTANAGSYYFVVTNSFGSATSGVASLTVLPNGASSVASPLWSVVPGSRPYITGAGTDTQRGLGYDANSNRVVVVTRTAHTNLNDGVTVVPFGAILLDANTGAEAGELDMTTLWNSAGTLPGLNGILVNMCGVAEDGTVYIGNLLGSADSSTFAIYSWPAADPAAAMNGTPAYFSNPLGTVYPGSAGLGRIGDTMAVRGAGTNTQILCTFRNGTNVCIFTTADGISFDAHVIAVTNLSASAGLTDPFSGASPLGLGCAFGSGNTFWAKSSTYNLRQVSFNLDDNTAAVVASYPISGTSAPLGVNTAGGYIGIIGHNETPMNLAVYNINDPTNRLSTSTLDDRELFALGTNSVANGNGTGNVAFDAKRGRIFALSSNNGIIGLQVNPALPEATAVPSGGIITWAGPGILESKTDLQATWIEVLGGVSPYTNTAASQMFFRVRR